MVCPIKMLSVRLQKIQMTQLKNGAAISNEKLTTATKASTLASKAQATALKAVSIAGNMLAMMAIAKGIELVVTGINNYIHRMDNAKDALETSQQAFEESRAEVEELETQLQDCTTRLDELQKLADSGNISIVEQEELEKLKQTNDELNRELRLKRDLALMDANDVAEASSGMMTTTVTSDYTEHGIDTNSIGGQSVYVEEELNRAILAYKNYYKEREDLNRKYDNGEIGSVTYQEALQTIEENMVSARDRITEMQTIAENAKAAYADVEAFGGILTGEDLENYDTAMRMTEAYDAWAKSVDATANSFENLSEKEKRSRVRSELIKSGVKTDDAYGIVGNLTEKDLDIVANVSLGVHAPKLEDYDTAEEYGKAYAQAWLNAANNEIEDNPLDLKVNTSDYLSNLESLSDSFEQISAIYKDVQDMGEFDFSALAKDSDFSKTFQDAGQAYQDFIDVVANSPSDINKCQSAFDDLVSAWFYGQAPLKDITEETYNLTVAWLKQKGVANAVEVADNALIESKKRLFIETHTLKEGTKEEIQALFDEASAAGFSENAMYSLAAAIATADDSQLTFEQQINAIYDIASAAGLASEALNSLITAAPADASSIDLGSWSEAAKNGTLNEWRKAQQTKQKLNGVKTAFNNWLSQNKMEYKPSVNYVGGGSGSGSSGSSGSASDPHIAEVDAYKNLTDAVSEYDRKLEKLERTYDDTDSIQERIGLKKAEIKLYQEQKDAIDALNKVRDKEISANVDKLRSVGFKIDYDPNTENLIIHNREHINSLSQDIIETYEDLLSTTDELNDANKDSADQWDELTSSIVKAGKELKDLEQEKYEDYIEGAEHLLRLMENRKDAFGKESSVYTDMMNATLKRWKNLATTDYQGNIDQIRELEEQWMDFYDARIEKEKEILEMQLDDNDRVLDGVIKVIDDQIKALDDQIDGLSKANDERKKALELQKAQAELDKQRNQKTRHVLRKGQGWVWEADDDAIKEAEENLSDLKYESKVDAIEDDKEALEELKEKIEEIPQAWEDEQNRLLMIERFGADAEEKILSGRLDVIEDFKDDYIDIQEQIQDKTDELEEHTSAAYLNVVKAFENMAKLAGIGLDSGATTQKTQSSWYVNKDGKAPSQAQVGDLVYTKGGTYEITSKDENGKFTSKKIDNVSTPITEDQWGTKISERVIESGEDVVDSVENIIRINEDLVDKTKKQILTDANLQKYIEDNSKYTAEEIVALLDNSDVTDMLADYTDDNSDATDDNTDAIYDWIDALNNFELNTVQQQILVDEELSNALAKFDDSTMSPEDQAYLKEIQKAWNTAKAQGNQELMDELHALADSIREQYINGTLRPLVNGLDYNRIGADGYSKNFTENSRSDAYGGAPVTGIVGSTTSIWGLDSTDPDEVQKAIDRGWITEEESKNLVQLSGGRYNSDGSKKVATNTGKDLSDTSKWKSEEIRSNTTDSGNGTWTTTRYTNVETGETITKTDYEKNRKATNDNTSSLNDNTDASNYSGDSNYDATDSIHSDVESNNKSMSTLGSKIDNLSNTVEKADLSGSNSSFGGSSKGSSGNKGGGSDSGYKMDNDPKSPTFGVRVKQHAKGGTNIPAGMANVDEEGAELLVKPDKGRIIEFEYDGNTVFDAHTTANIMKFANDPDTFIGSYMNRDQNQVVYTAGGDKVIHYSIGSINPTLPNVTKPDEFWDEFTRNLPNEAKQWGTTGY